MQEAELDTQVTVEDAPPELTESRSKGVIMGAIDFEKKFSSPFYAIWEYTKVTGERDYLPWKSARPIDEERERGLVLATLMLLGVIPSKAEPHVAHSMPLSALRETLRSAFYR